eukprot:symbB.v1.2.003321.t1/scaffold187.1/size278738/6
MLETTKATSSSSRVVVQQMHQLRISLPEALRQVNTQRHPGAYLLLTCHLGKERPPACQNFPWISLGALLLLIGVLCGPSRQDRPSRSLHPSSMEGPEAAGNAHEVTVIPMVLGALFVCFGRSCRGVDEVLCMALISMISISLLGSRFFPNDSTTSWNRSDNRLGVRSNEGRPWNEIGSPETRCFTKAFHRSKVGISNGAWHPR